MNKVVVRVKLLIILLAIIFPVLLQAQPGDFGDDVLDNPVPFDGGVSLLVAAGIGYGIKKARDYRKNEKNKVS